MEVKLLSYTPEPERVVATAARTCYSAKRPQEIWEDMADKEKVARAISIITKSGHESPIEHASFTFAISGASRSLLAQLSRHRLVSLSVQSQRYVKYDGEVGVVIPLPDDVDEEDETYQIYADTIGACLNSYRELLEKGVPAEDARFVLPEAMSTNIVITANARELKHIFRLRCCNRAQWEIRALAEAMFTLVYPIAPTIFADAGPSCVATGKCPEAERSCGKIADVQKMYRGFKESVDGKEES